MSDTDTAAPTAHDQMMEHYLAGNQQGAQALSKQVNQEARIDQPPQDDGDVSMRLAPMPPAPKSEAAAVDRAISTLTELGGDHAALVQEWQTSGANIGEELAYAKSAFQKYATPELIAKFDLSGMGNDPDVIRFLAKQGRLDAGFMGDFSVARNSNAPGPAAGGPSFSASAKTEINQIMKDNPPGSQGYKNPAVQRRLQELHRATAGDQPMIGQGGRTA